MRLGCEETKKNSQPRLVFRFFLFLLFGRRNILIKKRDEFLLGTGYNSVG